jgi:HK97 gp10 family phage protein
MGQLRWLGRNSSGYRRTLKSPEMTLAVRSAAEVIATKARAIAPKDTGRYAASIKVSVNRRGGIRGDRVEGVVTATAPYSAAIEFGNSKSQARHVLKRAAGI